MFFPLRSEDRAGNAWVGLHLAGLARYDSKRFTMFNGNDGTKRLDSRHYCDHSGRLWCRVETVQSHRQSTGCTSVFVHYTVAEGLSSNQVNCIPRINGAASTVRVEV